MSNQTLINTPAFEKIFKAELNAEMTKAAEPIIQEALTKIERQMRARLGECLIRVINTEYSVYADQRNIRIEFARKQK